MRIRKTPALAGLILFLIIFAGVIHRVRSRASSLVLPDGSRMEVVEISSGTNHIPNPFSASQWRIFLIKTLPQTWRHWLGMPNLPTDWSVVFPPTAGTNLVLVTCQKLNPNAPALTKADRVQIVEEGGAIFEADSDAFLITSRHEIVRAWRFPAFPRRSKTLRCRFLEKLSKEKYQTVGELVMQNPATDPYSFWSHETIPNSKTSGDLTVTLTDFVTGLRPGLDSPLMSPSQARDRPTTRLKFSLADQGSNGPSWRVASVVVRDATGNCWKPPLGEATTGMLPGELSTEFPGNFSASETAFSLRIELSRTNDFGSDELWRVPDIPVPPPERVILLARETVKSHAVVALVAVGGLDADLPGPFASVGAGERVNLALKIKSNDVRLTLVSVVDNQKQPIPFQERESGSDENRCFALKIEETSKSLHATFAVHPSRFVEFRVKPRQRGR